MSKELRELLYKHSRILRKYQDEIDPPDRLAIVSFLDEDKYANMEDHNRPLFFSESSGISHYLSYG